VAAKVRAARAGKGLAAAARHKISCALSAAYPQGIPAASRHLSSPTTPGRGAGGGGGAVPSSAVEEQLASGATGCAICPPAPIRCAPPPDGFANFSSRCGRHRWRTAVSRPASRLRLCCFPSSHPPCNSRQEIFSREGHVWRLGHASASKSSEMAQRTMWGLTRWGGGGIFSVSGTSKREIPAKMEKIEILGHL